MSSKFNQIRDSFHSTLDEKKRESVEQTDQLYKELDGLVRYVKLNRKEFKREAKERHDTEQ